MRKALLLLLVCLAFFAACQTQVRDTVTGILITPEELTLEKGETMMLGLEITPSGSDGQTVVWRSTDSTIVSVSGGMVEAISNGHAVVSASIGDVTGVCMVSVEGSSVESIVLDKEHIILEKGETAVIKATVFPEGSDMSELVWSSTDKSVVDVDGEGNIAAISEGVATITASIGDVTASCHATVLGTAKVGDYYYSDGTYSSDLYPEKKVVGIVFWTGDPTAEDPALKSEHPQCTHGLVIALAGESLSSWQSNYASMHGTVGEWVEANTDYESITTGTEAGDNLNRIMGYNNTRAIELFNDDANNSGWKVEAMNVVRFFRSNEEFKAPESSSGWYLPSVKELSLLCTGRYDGNIWDITGSTGNIAAINERLGTVENAEVIISDNCYWSSSENLNDVAFGLFMYNGMVGNFYKDVNYNYVRCVLAF